MVLLCEAVPSRPVLRWHGGKWRLAPWIIGHFPPHRVYVESFGGAASVLLRKPRSYGEVYNDLDADVINLFRVLRGDRADELAEALRLTPFARDEFNGAYAPTDDAVERARKLVVRSFMGFGSDGHNRDSRRTGFRANSSRPNTTPAHDWANYPDALGRIIERLVGVVIENRDALDCMAQHDGPSTLHYVDPPYLPETRSQKVKLGKRFHVYAHELTPEDHGRLLAFVEGLEGMVLLSGYSSPIYDAALADWHRVERATFADGARPRVEMLWMNPQAWNMLEQPSGPLFQEARA